MIEPLTSRHQHDAFLGDAEWTERWRAWRASGRTDTAPTTREQALEEAIRTVLALSPVHVSPGARAILVAGLRRGVPESEWRERALAAEHGNRAQAQTIGELLVLVDALGGLR